MVERRVRIDRERFHLRPIAAFLRLAQTFESDVRDFAADVQASIEPLPMDPVLEPEERLELAAELQRLEGALAGAREVLRSSG